MRDIVLSRLLLDKMRIIGFLLWQASHKAKRTWFRVVCKALIAEGTKIFRLVNSVLDDESSHGPPAGLCPYGLYLQIAPLTDIEQWLNNANLLAYTLPVEEMLVFLGGKMNQDAVICFHGIYQDICQAALPETEHILSSSAWQFHMALHPIRKYTIQRTKQAVEERGNP